jgi:uncharacterized protein YjbI with pentapeptide repeats
MVAKTDSESRTVHGFGSGRFRCFNSGSFKLSSARSHIMSSKPPQIKDDPMYRLLREGSVDEFNRRRDKGETCDLRGSDFRHFDLRGLDAKGLDLRDCYFRQTDLRGVDLSEANLEGASINAAKISGTYFPKELSAEELTLSLVHGIRMRYGKA